MKESNNIRRKGVGKKPTSPSDFPDWFKKSGYGDGYGNGYGYGDGNGDGYGNGVVDCLGNGYGIKEPGKVLVKKNV